MKYIVLDLEWNQPRYAQGAVTEPVALKGEIIQIGAVRLDEGMTEEDRIRLLISPCRYKKMNSAVSRLTKIKNADLKQGVPFPEAFERFSEFCTDSFLLMTWGPDDIPILRSNLILHKIDPAWIPGTCDLQRVFADQIAKEKRQFSLAAALSAVGETMEDAHDALNDALGAAAVCGHLDLPGWLSRKEEPEKRYVSRSSAVNDPELKRFLLTDEVLTVEKWKARRLDHYSAVLSDKNGTEYLATLRLRRLSDGFRAVRALRPAVSAQKAPVETVPGKETIKAL